MGQAAGPCLGIPLSSLFCRLFFIISIQGRVQLGLDLSILEYDVGRIWTYFNRHHLVVMRNYYSNYIVLYTQNGKISFDMIESLQQSNLLSLPQTLYSLQ